MLSATHLIGFGAGGVGGRGWYPIDYSCRFNDDDTAFTRRTLSGAGTSQKKMVMFGAFKLGDASGARRMVFGFDDPTPNDQTFMEITAADKIRILAQDTADNTRIDWLSTQVLRDHHGWYFWVWSINSDTSSPTNYFSLNGVEVTAWTKTTALAQDDEFSFGKAGCRLSIGSDGNGANPFEGYQSYVGYQDGQSVTTSTGHGEFDDNGVWRPIDVSGLDFGNNGFLLDYAVAPGTADGAGTIANITNPIPASSKLLVHSNTSDASTTFVDSVGGKTITAVGNAQHDTAQYKFGTTGILLDGAGDALTLADSGDWDIGTGDFTCAAWGRIYTDTGDQTIMCHYRGSTGQRAWAFQVVAATNKLRFLMFNTVPSIVTVETDWSPNTDTWYHMAVTRTGGKIYFFVDGVLLVPGIDNTTTIFSGSAKFTIGALNDGGDDFWNGWLDEVLFIKGRALWTANFTPPTAAYGAGMNFTDSGLEANDRVVDNPTNNFMTISSLSKFGGDTLADGNLVWSQQAGAGGDGMVGSMWITSGKWYWEVTIDVLTAGSWVGVWGGFGPYASTAFSPWNSNNDIAADHGTWVIKPSTGYVIDGDGQGDPGTNASLSTFSATDVISFALDMDQGAGSNKLWIGKEGTWETSGNPDSDSGEIFDNLPAGVTIAIAPRGLGPDAYTFNFGSSTAGFTYDGSIGNIVGFKAINTTNLPVPAIKDGSVHVQPHAYTGTGIAHTETLTGNSDLTSSDIVFIKNRDTTDYGHVHNIIRTATKYVDTARSQNEETDANSVTSLGDSDAFDLGTGAGGWNDYNEKFATWIAYLDGTTGATNSNGNVDATVAANTPAGISLGIYTPTGTTAARQVGHGLNAAPEVVMAWNLTDDEWSVFGCTALGWTKALYQRATAPSTGSQWWNDLAPTYSGTASEQIINFGTQLGLEDKTFQFIAMHSVAGFSKFTSYIGNGVADGPLVTLDFKPAVVWIIRTNVSVVTQVDITLSPFNEINSVYGDMWGSAIPQGNTVVLDILSNGIKIRHDGGNINDNGVTYGVMAWAENPFGGHGGTFGSGVSPATAR